MSTFPFQALKQLLVSLLATFLVSRLRSLARLWLVVQGLTFSVCLVIGILLLVFATGTSLHIEAGFIIVFSLFPLGGAIYGLFFARKLWEVAEEMISNWLYRLET